MVVCPMCSRGVLRLGLEDYYCDICGSMFQVEEDGWKLLWNSVITGVGIAIGFAIIEGIKRVFFKEG